MLIDKDECYYLGYVSKKQGFKGGVIAFLDVDDPGNYARLDSVLVELDGILTPYFIDHILLKDKNFVFLKIEGVDDGDTADRLVGKNLYLPLDVLPEPGEGEYYLHELPGMEVIDSTQGLLGCAEQVLDYSNNPLLQLWYGGSEVLIPLNPQFIERVDRREKKIYVTLPEGLLSINAK